MSDQKSKYKNGKVWEEFYLRCHKDLYEKFISSDCETLKKEILSLHEGMIKNNQEVESNFPNYLSGDLKVCLEWLVKKYKQTLDIFGRLYVLDVFVLGNPKVGPVSKVSKTLEEKLRCLPVYRSMGRNHSEDRVNGEISSLIGDLLYGDKKAYYKRVGEIVDHPNSEKILDSVDVIKRMVELNELSMTVAKKNFYSTFPALRYFIGFFYKRIVEKDLNLDDPEEIEGGLKEIENFI